jgi:hypothetical protein
MPRVAQLFFARRQLDEQVQFGHAAASAARSASSRVANDPAVATESLSPAVASQRPSDANTPAQRPFEWCRRYQGPDIGRA